MRLNDRVVVDPDAPRCSRPGRAVFGRFPHSLHRKNRVIDDSTSVPGQASTLTSLYHPQPQVGSMVGIITLLVPMDTCSLANKGTENTLLDFRQALEAMKALDSKEPDVSTNNKSWPR